MKNNIFKNFVGNFYIDFLLLIFFTHVYYKLSFVNSINEDFLLLDQIRNQNVTSTFFFVESPVFTILSLLFGIENIDVFKLLVYFVTLLSFTLIVYNTKFLKNYSTLYLFGGWVVTCSWFMGFVDVLSVLFCTLICKAVYTSNPSYLKTFTWMLLMTINHNAISFGIFIIIFILIKNDYKPKFFFISFIAQLVGNLLVQIYLNTIGFAGRGRFRFIFNDNVIENSINFVSNNVLLVLWSGFLGISVIMLIIFNITNWESIRYILSALIVALLITSLGLDTSRVFSLLVCPIIIFILLEFENKSKVNFQMSYLYILVVISHFILGPYHLYGKIYKSSPMIFNESFYDFVPRIMNSLMSNIWS